MAHEPMEGAAQYHGDRGPIMGVQRELQQGGNRTQVTRKPSTSARRDRPASRVTGTCPPAIRPQHLPIGFVLSGSPVQDDSRPNAHCGSRRMRCRARSTSMSRLTWTAALGCAVLMCAGSFEPRRPPSRSWQPRPRAQVDGRTYVLLGPSAFGVTVQQDPLEYHAALSPTAPCAAPGATTTGKPAKKPRSAAG